MCCVRTQHNCQHPPPMKTPTTTMYTCHSTSTANANYPLTVNANCPPTVNANYPSASEGTSRPSATMQRPTQNIEACPCHQVRPPCVSQHPSSVRPCNLSLNYHKINNFILRTVVFYACITGYITAKNHD